jgi:hypothetical protein
MGRKLLLPCKPIPKGLSKKESSKLAFYLTKTFSHQRLHETKIESKAIRMKDNLNFYSLLLIGGCFIFSTANSQEALTSAGGSLKSVNGTISYTIGQLAYTTNIGANGFIVQGIQQPYEISVTYAGRTYTIYPNPTTNVLFIKVSGVINNPLTFRLLDLNAHLLESIQSILVETSINMNRYAASIYFLEVIEGNKVIKTFKIIKIK